MCGCSSIRSRIWWTSPSARIRPLLISRMFDGHRLDLVQDVARDDDALAGARPVAISRIVVRRASGSMPDSGSSRMSSSRIVDDRLRELDALAHALAVGADLLVRRVHQIDRRRARGAPPRRLPSRSRPFSRTSAVTHSSPVIRS